MWPNLIIVKCRIISDSSSLLITDVMNGKINQVFNSKGCNNYVLLHHEIVYLVVNCKRE